VSDFANADVGPPGSSVVPIVIVANHDPVAMWDPTPSPFKG
jgi:hypothetical protein